MVDSIGNHISNFLMKVYNDFLELIEERKCLCDLRAMTYADPEEFPDYSDIFIQQLYLLRYYPAYLIEYWYIYTQVFREQASNIPLDIHLLSIGCGACIDYTSILYAMDDLQIRSSVHYYGYDKVEWSYKPDLSTSPYSFFKQDIFQLPTFPLNTYNIIIFPKSIGEFDKNRDILYNLFKNTRFSSKTMILISSLREGRACIDNPIFSSIVDILINIHGYTLKNVPCVCQIQEKGLKKICPSFNYPDNIKQLFENGELLNRCKTFQQSKKKCEDKCDNLKRQIPILTCSHINYQYAILEK